MQVLQVSPNGLRQSGLNSPDLRKIITIFITAYILRPTAGSTGQVTDSLPGTLGYSKRAEAIQIAVLPKSAGAPGETANPYVKADMALQYSTYVNGQGWQAVSSDGNTNGTTGAVIICGGAESKSYQCGL